MKKNTELDLSVNSKFTFKGLTLTPGDVVSLTAKSLSIEVQVAVTHVDEEGNLSSFSTLLMTFQHSGLFSPDDVKEIVIIKSGQESIATEARNPLLKYGERVKLLVNEIEMDGILIAAFDGVVVAWSPIYGFIYGGSIGFSPMT